MVVDYLFVRADGPLQLGMDVLHTFVLTLDFRNNVLSSADPPWNLLITHDGREPVFNSALSI